MPFFDTQHKTRIRWGPAGAYLRGRGSRRLSMEGGRHTAGTAPDRCCRNLDSSPNQRIRGILYRQCTKLKPSVGLLVTQTYQCTQTVYTFHKSYVLIRSYSVAQQRKSKSSRKPFQRPVMKRSAWAAAREDLDVIKTASSSGTASVASPLPNATPKGINYAGYVGHSALRT